MRDPMTWSLPLGRLIGVTIRVHLLFPIVALGLIGRVAYLDPRPGLWLEALLLMLLLFVSVLLHEFGHCFGARRMDRDASEVLLWPLGGLAFVDIPHTPRAHFVTAFAGPVVNLLLAGVTVLVLASASMLPSFNPLADPYTPTLYNFAEGRYVGSKAGTGDLAKYYGFKDGDNWVSSKEDPSKNDDVTPAANGKWMKGNKEVTQVPLLPSQVALLTPKEGRGSPLVLYEKDKIIENIKVEAEAVPYGLWLVQLSRFFWVNWMLFLLNLVPAFPLDGGRMLQAFLWWRSDYRA